MTDAGAPRKAAPGRCEHSQVVSSLPATNPVLAMLGGTGHRLLWPVTARAVPPAAFGCGSAAQWGRRFRLPSSSRVFDRAVVWAFEIFCILHDALPYFAFLGGIFVFAGMSNRLSGTL